MHRGRTGGQSDQKGTHTCTFFRLCDRGVLESMHAQVLDGCMRLCGLQARAHMFGGSMGTPWDTLQLRLHVANAFRWGSSTEAGAIPGAAHCPRALACLQVAMAWLSVVSCIHWTSHTHLCHGGLEEALLKHHYPWAHALQCGTMPPHTMCTAWTPSTTPMAPSHASAQAVQHGPSRFTLISWRAFNDQCIVLVRLPMQPGCAHHFREASAVAVVAELAPPNQPCADTTRWGCCCWNLGAPGRSEGPALLRPVVHCCNTQLSLQAGRAAKQLGLIVHAYATV